MDAYIRTLEHLRKMHYIQWFLIHHSPKLNDQMYYPISTAHIEPLKKSVNSIVDTLEKKAREVWRTGLDAYLPKSYANFAFPDTLKPLPYYIAGNHVEPGFEDLYDIIVIDDSD